MKANLLPCLSLLSISLLFALGLADRPAWAGAAVGQTSSATQAGASAQSKIEVESWTKPEAGWLYVLDAKPDAGGPGGRVWLVEPEAGKVMGSIRTGGNADFALSPDGSRLYVASITQGDSSELAVIDTGRGVVVQRGAVDDREVGNVLPSFSTMAVSGDGLAVRILRDTPKSAEADAFLLATFDTQSGEFSQRTVHLGNCGPGRFISYPSKDQFDILCPRSNRIRLIRVDGESRELQNEDIKLPWERRVGAALAVEVPDNQEIAIVRGDGGVFKMNLVTHEFTDTTARPVLPNRVPPAAWPTASDSSRAYVGFNKDYEKHYDNRFYLDYGRSPNLRPNDALAGEFHVFDMLTWRKVGTIKTKMPFWSAVIANDGKTLFAMAPQKHSILVIDTVKMREVRELKVGGAPALALVAP
jgi:hypothetical protein